MAMTPYPALNDEYEDPSILVSSDGATWSVPGGLTNPINDGGLSPLHNADPELVLDGSTMYCFWTHTTAGGGTYKIKRLQSTDLVSWTNLTDVLTGAGYIYVAPAICFFNGAWWLWYVDITTSPNTIKYRTASSLTGTWSSENSCTINNIPSGRDPWHLAIYRHSSGVLMLFLVTCTVDVSGSAARVGLATSSDGITWTFAYEVLRPSASGWDDTAIYRASGYEKANSDFDLWYSAWNASNVVKIGRTTAHVQLP